MDLVDSSILLDLAARAVLAGLLLWQTRIPVIAYGVDASGLERFVGLPRRIRAVKTDPLDQVLDVPGLRTSIRRPVIDDLLDLIARRRLRTSPSERS